MKLKTKLMALALAVGFSTSAFGQVLVQWDTAGFSGTETSIAATNVAANLNITAIGLGSALGTTSGGGGINTRDWDFNNLFGANGNYWGFSVTVDSGYTLELDTFQFTGRSSNTGPRDFAIRYDGDSFGSNLDTFSTSGTDYIAFDADLSGTGILSEGTYEFRVVAITSTRSNGDPDFSTGGTHRIMNYGSTSATASETPLNLTGTVSVIPEPQFYAALIGLLAIGFAIYRRRRS